MISRNLRTVWKLSKYGVYSGPYFPVFSPNTGKYAPIKTSYLGTFHAVRNLVILLDIWYDIAFFLMET